MAKNFNLEITTLYRDFFSGEVEKLIIPAHSGELEIMFHTLPMVATVKTGAIKIFQSGRWMEAATSDGFIRVTHDKVTLLSLSAAWPHEVSADNAECEIVTKADERKKSESLKEYKLAKAQLAVTLSKLKRSSKDK